MKGSRLYFSSLGGDERGYVSRWKRISRWMRYRKASVFLTLFIVVALGYAYFYGIPFKTRMMSLGLGDGKGLTIVGDKFVLNGEVFRIFSGSIHYFRVPRAYWRDRLLKLKAAGLNTVDTYVAWNMHEEIRGQYDYSGNLNLVEFLTIAHELGLYVILRPGPYICAEWDWGGLPAWLLTDPGMEIRSLQDTYAKAVEAFFMDLFGRVGHLQYSKSNGGPIIAVQIENEYGAYFDDKNYLLWLKELLIKVGVVEFLFTSDGPEYFERGYTPGVYAVVNFNYKTESALDALEKFQPGKPLMIGEFWPGWFDHWSEKHHTMPATDMVQRLEPAFKRGASINFYMFHGGTNFGFMNGANLIYPDQYKKEEGVLGRLWGRLSNLWSSDSQQYAAYRPTITSYDYDAPLNEFGGKTEKYTQLRELIDRYSNKGDKQLAVDPWTSWRPPTSYGDFNVQGYIPLTEALNFIKPIPIELTRPLFVEKIDASEAYRLYYGFVAYRTSIPSDSAKKISIDGVVADRMLIIVNGKTIATIQSDFDHAPTHQEINIAPAMAATGPDGDKKVNDLILLVENLGRANYVKMPHKLDRQYKGFNGSVTVDSPDGPIALENWKVYSVRFRTAAELQKMIASATAKSLWKPVNKEAIGQPAFFRVEFEVKNAATEFADDTFVLTKNWGKGVVWANGENLGRYWNVGPQQTLYLPGPWLKKGAMNELVLFELHQPSTSITLQADADLGTPCPVPCYA